MQQRSQQTPSPRPHREKNMNTSKVLSLWEKTNRLLGISKRTGTEDCCAFDRKKKRLQGNDRDRPKERTEKVRAATSDRGTYPGTEKEGAILKGGATAGGDKKGWWEGKESPRNRGPRSRSQQGLKTLLRIKVATMQTKRGKRTKSPARTQGATNDPRGSKDKKKGKRGSPCPRRGKPRKKHSI